MSVIQTVELVLILTIVCLLLSLFIFLYLCEKVLTDDDYTTIYGAISECLLYLEGVIRCCRTSRRVVVPSPQNNIQEPPRIIIVDDVIIENPMGLISLGTPSEDKT